MLAFIAWLRVINYHFMARASHRDVCFIFIFFKAGVLVTSTAVVCFLHIPGVN